MAHKTSKAVTYAKTEIDAKTKDGNMRSPVNGTLGSSEMRENGQKPRLLLMGLKRYGVSAIPNVLCLLKIELCI